MGSIYSPKKILWDDPIEYWGNTLRGLKQKIKDEIGPDDIGTGGAEGIAEKIRKRKKDADETE